MQMSAPPKKCSFGKTVVTSLLAGCLLLLCVLGASPSLHQFVHHDASAPDHNCAITQFAHGQVHTAAVLVLTVLVVFAFGLILLSETFLLLATDYRFSPSRAPPSR
jgi:hypothetical protein